MLVFVATACGGDETSVRRTSVPTPIPPTPTPRSTALPEVQEAPSLGTEGRAIELHFSVVDDLNAQRAANELERYLQDELELAISANPTTETLSLKALCTGRPAAAWLSAYSFAAANKQCGAIPVLAVKQGTPPRVTVGSSVDIIGRSTVRQVTDLKGKVFCRSAEHDLLTSWILPNLIMSSLGITPETDLAEVKDLPDDKALGQALLLGVCDGAALPPGTFDDFLDALSAELSTEEEEVTADDLASNIGIISPSGDTSFPANARDWEGFDRYVIPFEVLAFAPESSFPANLREDIVEAVADYFTDRTEGRNRIKDLLSADDIFEVELNDYDTFRNLLVSANWDMTWTE